MGDWHGGFLCDKCCSNNKDILVRNEDKSLSPNFSLCTDSSEMKHARANRLEQPRFHQIRRIYRLVNKQPAKGLVISQ